MSKLADFGNKIKSGSKKGLNSLAQQFDIDLFKDGEFDPSFRDDPLSIEKFRSAIDSGARANRYKVDIHCPKLGGLKLEGLRCINVNLPGRQIQTQDFSEYGSVRKYPFNVDHDNQEITLTFLCDSSFSDRLILEAWQGLIFSGKNGTGSSVNPQFMYYLDYIGEVDIVQIKMNGEDSLQCKLHEAYPISVAQQALSYDSGEILKLEVTFAFRTFENTYIQAETGGFLDGLNKGRKALDALSGLASLLGKEGDARNLQRFSDRINKLGGMLKKVDNSGVNAPAPQTKSSTGNTRHTGTGFGGR